ncbi:hypothetical protein CYPRO_1929 [Cyclonatronum proteinivorum]|uniref:Uncharacterized protein n=1 Tax=Cyclonatronum proteinivorum TaxID=1457365 RepID=A0A345UL27_9BACT|nr:hypothetical protein [Cyclonatronum proteinivorum]AXJ01179.1 hypothetical protein CYPRO_1929 [Cyclonatronum proteinivorum]
MQRLVHDLAYGLVNCGGKRTLTGMLSGSGNQFCDWTAAYRMFSKQRFDPQDLLDVSLRHGVSLAPDNAPVIAHIDDTLLKKQDAKYMVRNGSETRLDPLSTPILSGHSALYRPVSPARPLRSFVRHGVYR